jgi:hypothetical protein
MKIWWIALCLLVFVLVQPGSLLGPTDLGTAQEPHKPQDTGNESEAGHITLYDLQFGPAVVEDEKWKFLGNMRSFNTGLFGGRLTLMVKFSYRSSRPDIPLRFVIKLPEARQYEQTVKLSKIQGRFSYKFTVHEPAKFLGAGSLYIYYGLSIVDVLDFNILPGV